MTTRQHDYILSMLIRALLLPNPTAVHIRTDSTWGYIFRKTGTPIPSEGRAWPTIEVWMDSLSIHEASKAIDTLLHIIA